MCAGEIPRPGDFIMTRGWCFEVIHADDKRILHVRVEHLVGTFTESDESNNDDENPIRKMLRLNQNNKQTEFEEELEESDVATIHDDVVVISDGVDEGVDDDKKLHSLEDEELHLELSSENSIEEQMQDYIQSNKLEAKEVERMVESGERKRELLDAIRREQQEQQ